MSKTVNIQSYGPLSYAEKQGKAISGNEFHNCLNTVERSSISPELEKTLKDLINAVQKMTESMPEEKANPIKNKLDSFVTDVVKTKTDDKKWYHVSGEGLVDALKSLGNAGKPIVEIVGSIVKMV